MTELTFTKEENLGMACQAIACGDEGVVTFSVKMADGKAHKLLAQHSVDGVNWQSIGVMEFAGYAELNVDGLRPNVQKARIVLLDFATPQSAQWV